jgi:long-chain acyl-CoA synthetase
LTKVIDGKEVTVKYFELCDYKYQSYTERKETISEVSRALTGKDDVHPDQVRHSCMDYGSLLPLLRRGGSYSLNKPNSVGIFTNAELLPTLLKYVISDSEANQTILDSIPSLRAIQVFNVCITHANLIASVGAVNVLLGHHLTYEDSSFVELAMIFVSMPCGYGPVKTLTNASVRFSIMVGVPAVWERPSSSLEITKQKNITISLTNE